MRISGDVSGFNKKIKVSNTDQGELQSKEQLLQKVETLERRVKENAEKEEEEDRQHPRRMDLAELLNRQKHQQQSKNLESFDKKAAKWNELSTKISATLNRSPKHSLLSSSAFKHREKIEIVQAIESSKEPGAVLGMINT